MAALLEKTALVGASVLGAGGALCGAAVAGVDGLKMADMMLPKILMVVLLLVVRKNATPVATFHGGRVTGPVGRLRSGFREPPWKFPVRVIAGRCVQGDVSAAPFPGAAGRPPAQLERSMANSTASSSASFMGAFGNNASASRAMAP